MSADDIALQIVAGIYLGILLACVIYLLAHPRDAWAALVAILLTVRDWTLALGSWTRSGYRRARLGVLGRLGRIPERGPRPETGPRLTRIWVPAAVVALDETRDDGTIAVTLQPTTSDDPRALGFVIDVAPPGTPMRMPNGAVDARDEWRFFGAGPVESLGEYPANAPTSPDPLGFTGPECEHGEEPLGTMWSGDVALQYVNPDLVDIIAGRLEPEPEPEPVE